jgi:hypothetical protein
MIFVSKIAVLNANHVLNYVAINVLWYVQFVRKYLAKIVQ